MARKTGTVKFFNVEKGFGFITCDDASEDVFVHYSAIHTDGIQALGEAEPVEFSVEFDERKGKTRAANVTGPGGAPVSGGTKGQGGGKGKGGGGFGGGGGGGFGQGGGFSGGFQPQGGFGGGFPQQGYPPQAGGFQQQQPFGGGNFGGGGFGGGGFGGGKGFGQPQGYGKF